MRVDLWWGAFLMLSDSASSPQLIFKNENRGFICFMLLNLIYWEEGLYLDLNIAPLSFLTL